MSIGYAVKDHANGSIDATVNTLSVRTTHNAGLADAFIENLYGQRLPALGSMGNNIRAAEVAESQGHRPRQTLAALHPSALALLAPQPPKGNHEAGNEYDDVHQLVQGRRPLAFYDAIDGGSATSQRQHENTLPGDERIPRLPTLTRVPEVNPD
ncbi:MAG: hypothetical protein LBV61_08780 [Burkholderiaceae bacterium]|nr:hypothetical protein [Burkholderiaceae bacterium]